MRFLVVELLFKDIKNAIVDVLLIGIVSFDLLQLLDGWRNHRDEDDLIYRLQHKLKRHLTEHIFHRVYTE